ncbi:MAG: LVIVD repeat-containing protein [Myxococcales bacterium]
MSISRTRRTASRKRLLMGMVAAIAAMSAGQVLARDDDRGISQSGEQRNMRRVGHVDLQGRASYQPNVIVYPDGRTIAFAGTHNGSKANTLKPGNPVEPNGTMIIDVTDPTHPVEKAHIPVPVAGGQAQMARMCLGSDLPGGMKDHVYLMRNVQGTAAQRSGYELWDVTNVSSPVPVASLQGIRNTHKEWWECKTGIAYMPGSRDVAASTGQRWRTGQSMVIFDWSKPPATNVTAPIATVAPVVANYPKYVRTYGLVGAQPDGDTTKAAPASLHGAISTFEHPQAGKLLARATTKDTPDAVVGNRIYAAWGVGDDGVLQIIDRKKLLPGSLGGTWNGDPDRPTVADLEAPQAGLMTMSPDQGGHTSFPIFGLTPASYTNFTEFKTRDIVILSSEATADLCKESPHWAFVVDVTVENSKNAPPGTRVEQNAWHGPMVLSTMSVDPRRGEQFPRGNYCTRGARFGVHSSEENFRNPFYGRVTTIAFFTGGIRAFDIREPQAPVEVAFYVPQANANTVQPDGYMTNNVEIDDRGFIYATDRNGSGLDILELRGPAKKIALGIPLGKDDHDED